MQTVTNEKLAETGEALAVVLTEEGVICNYANPTHNEVEKRAFVNMLTTHAEDPKSYLEITYPGTCVRLLAKIKIVEGEAVLTEVDAYDHPWENEAINYERLNARLHETLSKLSA